VAIDSGLDATCALTAAGGVKCWGLGEHGELGNDSVQSSTIPVDVVGLAAPAVALSNADFRACVVTVDGAAACWGNTAEGKMLFGRVPLAVGGIAGAVEISVGVTETCARTSAGAVQCWGSNFLGQLGDGTSVQSETPVDVVGL